MVSLPVGLSALNRKLVRDLWEMKGQAVAIASVILAGVAMFVTYLSNFDSLQRTRAAYYQVTRFADVFAGSKRAPTSLEPRIAALPGVEVVATRVVADVTLDVPALAEPATGRLISLPERGRPPLNDVVLRAGRWVDPGRADEVLASEAFCDAHGFEPGDQVAAIINGRRRLLTIVGIVLSPEYVYSVRPGELFPDSLRFGVFWLGRPGLAAAFDMAGGFNDVSLALARDASTEEVIAGLDQLLEPYGGLGAVPRLQQTSAWIIENEMKQLQTFGFITPLIFLGVAAFVLHIALTRALALQRPQIAALKALGYSNRELAWHYIKWALLIAAAGAGAGVLAGAWLGSGLIALYNEYFRFPALDYQLSVGVAVMSMIGSLVVAAVGAQSAVRRAVAVPPAEAMRPEPPARYRRSLVEHSWSRLRPALVTRMVLRNIERQPIRALVSVTGLALAVAVLFVGLAFIDVMNRLIDQQFNETMRQDATVTFVEPRAARAVHGVGRLPGVLAVEPMRIVPARLRAGHRSRTIAITGAPENPRLNRILDRRGQVHTLPPRGLLLSKTLGEVLGVGAGSLLRVEVLEGRRPALDVPVAGLVDDSFGLQAYMNLDAVHQMLRESELLSGAAVSLDEAELPRFYAAVKETPMVAGASLRAVMLQNFRQSMAETMNLQILFNVLFAAIIAFGVVYNSARVSLSERSRELASLRVLGFTRAEISMILLGELALLTLLSLPLGAGIGYVLGELILAGLSNEIFRLSFVVEPSTVAWSFLTVIGAASVSGLLVRRQLDRLDLVAVLKTRE